MPSNGDSGNEECDRKIEKQKGSNLRSHRIDTALLVRHSGDPHQPEDCTRRTSMKAIWLQQQRTKRTTSEAGNIEKQHLHAPKSDLEHPSQLIQQVHVEPEMQEPEVDEAR